MEPEIRNLGKVSVTVEGEHDFLKEYNRLSLVKITQDNGIACYISKRRVPKRVSILDTKYWMPITKADESIKPVNEGLLTLIQGNTILGTFSANSATNVEIQIPESEEVNDGKLTIKANGETVGTFSANESTDKTINLFIPTNASDVYALSDSTKYAKGISVSINPSTYVVTFQLIDQDGNDIGSSQSIDLPLESVVVSGSYNNATKKIVLTLQNGSTIDVPVGDLINGLQSEITTQNPLSADLLADGTTNVVYTATEQNKLAGIQAGAEVNVQSDWNQSNSSADDFIKNKPTIPDVTGKADKVSNAINGNFASLDTNGNLVDSGHKHSDYLTSHQDISGKADKVSSPTNGNFAGLDSNGNLTDSGSKASDFLTQHQDISGKADKSEMSVVDGTGSDADKTTITLKTGTSATVLKSHQDISGKQDVINSSNKLSADYIVDGTTNKVINVKPDWNAAAGTVAEILNKPTIPDAVSGTNDGTNWTSLTIGNDTYSIPAGGGGGLSNYDFTHVANTTVSTSTTTITFAANQRGSQMITVSADIGITFDVRNLSDNYLWIKNTGGSEIDVTISSVVNDQTAVSNVYVPADGISVPAGGLCEIGIVRNADGAFITSRNDLEL